MRHHRAYSKNLMPRDSDSDSDDDEQSHKRYSKNLSVGMMGQLGAEEELPAKHFDDEEITRLVRQYVDIGDETAEEAIVIALKIRKKTHYHLLPQKILDLYASKEERYAQTVAHRKTNRPGDGYATFRRFAVDPYGTDRSGSALELRTYLQQHTEGSALNPADGAANPPPNSSPMLMKKWQYEVVRQLVVELNWLLAQVKRDGNPEALKKVMGVGSKFTFLCSGGHIPPKECSAEDYMVHMLDQSAETLTNTKLFPPNARTISANGMKRICDIVRRIYRIFPHCLYYQPDVFKSFEERRRLYARFLAFNEVSNFISHKKLQPYISKSQLTKFMSR